MKRVIQNICALVRAVAYEVGRFEAARTQASITYFESKR